MVTIEARVEQLEKKVSALWNLTRILTQWLNETQKGQDSLKAIIERKEYKRLLEEVKDGAEFIEEFLKGEREERLY